LKGVAGSEDEAEDEGKFTDMEMNSLISEVGRFKDEVITLQRNNELKAEGTKLQRDFVVLVRETQYNSKADKFQSKLENVNVIIGKSEAVDCARRHIQKFLDNFKGNFKSTWREQKM